MCTCILHAIPLCICQPEYMLRARHLVPQGRLWEVLRLSLAALGAVYGARPWHLAKQHLLH